MVINERFSRIRRLNTVEVGREKISDTSPLCKAPFHSPRSQPCVGHRHKTPKTGLLARILTFKSKERSGFVAHAHGKLFTAYHFDALV